MFNIFPYLLTGITFALQFNVTVRLSVHQSSYKETLEIR